MRVILWIAAGALAIGCGSSTKAVKGPTFKAGAAVRITDGGQIFDALNTTNCVKWPSPQVKQKAGRDGWKGFDPGAGLEGKVVAALAHCDGKTQVVLVEVGPYVVPVTSKGVEDAAVASKEVVPPAEIIGELGLGGDAYGYGGLGYGDEYGGDWDGYGGIEGGVVGGVVGGFGTSTLYYPGDTVEIVSAGEIYSDINTTDCIAWPSTEAKDKGGQNAWGSYYPANGDIGLVLGNATHCSGGTDIVILDVNGHIVPINAIGVVYYCPDC